MFLKIVTLAEGVSVGLFLAVMLLLSPTGNKHKNCFILQLLLHK